MEAILTVGISASGKTTWAEQYIAGDPNWENVNRDSIRWDIMRESGVVPSWANWKWKWENKVTERADNAIRSAAERGKNLIISDTNLSELRRIQLRAKLEKEWGYTVTYKFFEISWDEAVKRDNARANGVGYAVIQKQHQDYLDTMNYRPEQDKLNRAAVIVDLDGTVAKMNGNRGPFEWHKVGEDIPNEPVCEMVRGLAAAGNFILFTSGRDGVCHPQTFEWLERTFPTLRAGRDWELHMRPEGDQRKDTEIKKEIFYRDILPNFYVRFAIDDRPCIVRLWLDLGIPVAAVGNPYVEF